MNPEQISALSRLKEILLENLRPHIVAITDAFLIPEQFIQSGFTKGNPYQVLRFCKTLWAKYKSSIICSARA